jgi:rhodanese-related sulfurtransferase
VFKKYQDIPSYEQDKKYYIDWGNNDLFTLETRGSGECSAGLLDMIESEIKVIEKCLESISGQQEVAEQTVLLQELAISSSKLLCLTIQKQPESDKELFINTATHFFGNANFPHEYQSIFDLVLEGNFSALIRNKDKVIEYANKAILYFKNLDDSLHIKQELQEITVKELKELIDKKQEFELIDVREQWEKEIADIGGLLIPLGSIEANIDKIPKNKPTIIYCRTGRRSAEAINQVAKKYGYVNLLNLKGGIHAWSDDVDNTIQKY